MGKERSAEAALPRPAWGHTQANITGFWAMCENAPRIKKNRSWFLLIELAIFFDHAPQSTQCKALMSQV